MTVSAAGIQNASRYSATSGLFRPSPKTRLRIVGALTRDEIPEGFAINHSSDQDFLPYLPANLFLNFSMRPAVSTNLTRPV